MTKADQVVAPQRGDVGGLVDQLAVAPDAVARQVGAHVDVVAQRGQQRMARRRPRRAAGRAWGCAGRRAGSRPPAPAAGSPGCPAPGCRPGRWCAASTRLGESARVRPGLVLLNPDPRLAARWGCVNFDDGRFWASGPATGKRVFSRSAHRIFRWRIPRRGAPGAADPGVAVPASAPGARRRCRPAFAAAPSLGRRASSGGWAAAAARRRTASAFSGMRRASRCTTALGSVASPSPSSTSCAIALIDEML